MCGLYIGFFFFRISFLSCEKFLYHFILNDSMRETQFPIAISFISLLSHLRFLFPLSSLAGITPFGRSNNPRQISVVT